MKIADFGFAKKIDDDNIDPKKECNSYKGTKKGYMPPEILECEK